MHGPYYYRRWRDEETNQRREYVPPSDVEEVQAAIQKRRCHLKRERNERAEWMNQGEGNGRPRDCWRRESRPSPLEKVDRLVGALDAVL